MAIIENWYIENTQNYPLTINDIATSITLQPVGQYGYKVDALLVGNNTAEVIGSSDVIRNLVNQGFILSDYVHSHDDFSILSHTHYGLDVLTTGSSSDASSLHTHSNLVSSVDFNEMVDSIVEEYVSNLDETYVRKDGSINQLSDISFSGEEISVAVNKAHDKDHNILEHIDGDYPFTILNLKKLFDGSNADCLHTHNGSGGSFEGEHNDLDGLQGGYSDQYYHLSFSDYSWISNIEVTSDEINQALDGIGSSVTSNNLTLLTDGSNADSLHTHLGLILDHNLMNGLQGGTFLNPSADPEYYHLDYEQYISLIGGPSVNADMYHTHDFPSTAYEIPLGEACDGDWTDGLFGWTEETLTSCAIDDINEILSSLAPPPAPDLDNIDIDTLVGVSGSLSFDSTHPIAEDTYYGVDGNVELSTVPVDGIFTRSGNRAGIINTSTDIVGTLNEDVAAHEYSYPANAFGSGNLGELKLEVNGVILRTIDLSTAGAIDDGTSTSGFTISSASPCEFANGDPFIQFQYRTGSYRIDSSDMRLGWNYSRVIHTIGGSDTVTNYIDWVVDGNSVSTAFSGVVFDNLIMTGSSYLSGVRYYTGGVADYDITIDNGQRNTYITYNAISFSKINGSMNSLSFLATGGNELQPTVISNRIFTVNSGIRLLNDYIANRTNINRTVQSDVNSGYVYIYNILMDDLISGASGEDDSSEGFVAEGYRLTSDLDITDISYSSGPQGGPSAYTWNSIESLVGISSAYNDGLLQCNGRLSYPNNTSDNNVSNGDFRNVSDGGSIVYGYNGNPNYSSASGERVYLRYFYDSFSRQNFNFNLTTTNTNFVTASNIGSLSGNNVACEVLAPNTTSDGVSVEWKDMVTAYTSDIAIGAYAGTYGSSIPSNWGVTIGTKSTATSGNVIVLRITAPSSWTGTISNIECNFL